MQSVLRGLIPLVLLTAAGCSDSHESIYSGVVSTHQEINDILAGVDADSDPDRTADAIQVQVENLMDLEARAAQMEPPDPDTQARLRQEFSEQIKTEKERSRQLAESLQKDHPLVWQKVNVALTKLQSH